MRYAPSYFEHNAGEAQSHVPGASARDYVEFRDVTIEVQTITVDDLSASQRIAYERAFK